MRNATIATSRTRATTDLIEYRPLPEEWGDRESLHAVRAAKARAAERGLDPSTLEIEAVPVPAGRRRPHRGLLASLRRGPGVHRRPGHGGGRLVAA